MKKLLLILLLFAKVSYGQVLTRSFDISNRVGLTTKGENIANRSISAHVFTWSLQSGVMTACTLSFQTSPDNVTWTEQTTGDCTSSGTSTYLIYVTNYFRISATTFTVQSGTALVTVNWAGYIIPPTSIATITTSPLNNQNINNIRWAINYSGANGGAKIVSAINDLGSVGGIVYSTFATGQTVSTDALSATTNATAPVQLVFGAATYSFSVTSSIASNISIYASKGATLCPALGTTLTINGDFDGSLDQHFCTGSVGTVVFGSGARLRNGIYPQWWGADPATTDNGIPFNAAILASNCAGEITVPSGIYNFATQIQIFKTSIQCKIRFIGASTFSTKLNWNGATNGVAIVLEHAIRFEFSNIEILNGSSVGTTVGLQVQSASVGSDIGPGLFSNVSVVGFQTCFKLGLSSGESVSELYFVNPEANTCTTGFKIDGSQTLNLQFKNLNLASNTTGMSVANGGFINIQGGSASGDTTDFSFTTGGTIFTVRDFRSEQIVTRGIDNVSTSAQPTVITVENCGFLPASGSLTMIAGSTGLSVWDIHDSQIIGTVSPGAGAASILFSNNVVLGGGSHGLPFTDTNETSMYYSQELNYQAVSSGDWSIGSRFNNSKGTIISTTKKDTFLWNNNGILINGGINSAGTGYTTLRGAVGCTTSASVGATCTSSAQNFTTSLGDTNYTLSCSLDTPTGAPVVSSVSRSAASFTITIAALTTSAATANYNCIASHD